MFRLKQLLIGWLLMVSTVCHSQDIESVIKAPLLSANGGLSLSQIVQNNSNKEYNTDPYNYYLSGNLNLSVLGVVNVPISLSYTNNEATANMTMPFNRFAISPSYKWITVHAGYSAMNFSPYTLNGHEFSGAGVELSPKGKMKFSAMYGRFKKAIAADEHGTTPEYRRIGGGFKTEYHGETLDLAVNLFKAKDDINSLIFEEQDENYVTPQDNLTGSVAIGLRLPLNVSLNTEYGLSALNRDIGSSSAQNFADNLIQTDGDFALFHAFNTNITQSSDLGQIGLTYERVDPNYSTFGAYYFTNDFENITVNASSPLIKWFQWAVDVGYQRDNIEKQKSTTNKRLIYSANVSSSISKRLTLGMNLSNLQSFVHVKDIYKEISKTNEFENLDTLSFTQMNFTLGSNANFVIQSTKTHRQNLNLSFSYQKAAEEQDDDRTYVGSQIYNLLGAYQFAFTPAKLNLSGNINYNANHMSNDTMYVTSYSLSVQKQLWEVLRTGLVATYSTTSNSDGPLSDIINLRLTLGYKLNKKHLFNFSLAMLDNKSNRKKNQQLSINLNYSYSFGMKLKRDGKKLGFESDF